MHQSTVAAFEELRLCAGIIHSAADGRLCRWEFSPDDYFEVVTVANVAGGSFAMRHAPLPKPRIKDRTRAVTAKHVIAGYGASALVRLPHRASRDSAG